MRQQCGIQLRQLLPFFILHKQTESLQHFTAPCHPTHLIATWSPLATVSEPGAALFSKENQMPSPLT